MIKNKNPMKFALAMLLLLRPLAMTAQEAPVVIPEPQERGRFFFEVTSQYLSFGHHDLNGSLVLGNADQVFSIPRVDPSLGFGVGLGRRFRSGLWAFSYLVSGHDVAFRGHASTAVSRLVQVSARTFLFRTRPVRLFLHFGLDFPWLKVRDDVADKRGRLSDATYAGVGANAGLGLLAPVSSRMFFSASLNYRFLAYLYAYGPVKGIDVTDLFDDVTGPRHHGVLRAPVIALELSLGYEL
jgi:hypothetical protein